MNAHELPEDYRQWPKDPHALLGVPETSDERTLKRAYTQLIRKYKPELAPEEFKLLRGAYEQACLTCQYRAQFQALRDEHFPEIVEAIVVDSTSSSRELSTSTPHAESPSPSVLRSFADRNHELPDEAWKLVLEGKVLEGLRKLKEWDSLALPQHSHTWMAYARIYWIATLCPELQADAYGGLLRAIQKLETPGGLLELLRRESLQYPERTLNPEYATLLTHSQNTDSLLHLTDIRWAAAAKLVQHSTIYSDLEKLRSRFAYDEEIVWGRMVIQALENFMAAEFNRPYDVQMANLPNFLKALSRYFDELKNSTHLHRELEQELDRMDYLRQFLISLQKRTRIAVGPILAPWVNLLNRFYFIPAVESDRLIPAMIQALVRDPAKGIAELDMLLPQETLIAPAVNIIQRYLLLRDYQPPENPPKLTPMLPPLDIIEDQNAYTAGVRPYLIKLCFQESISPTDAAVELRRSRQFEWDLEGWIEQDRVLHYLYWAWSAYHQ